MKKFLYWVCTICFIIAIAQYSYLFGQYSESINKNEKPTTFGDVEVFRSDGPHFVVYTEKHPSVIITLIGNKKSKGIRMEVKIRE